MLLLFKPFLSVETNLKNQHVLWIDVYTNEKIYIEKMQLKNIYNFNISNECMLMNWKICNHKYNNITK